MHGRTVRLFLVDGTPTGILTAEIMNWTGHVLVAPRSKLPEALTRAEASKTGVYFLAGDDPDLPSRLKVYVGEGDSVIDRIKAHAKDSSKDYWTHVYIVTSKDANLTKAHARYLESRLVELAKAADRATVANGNDPAAKQLPESDVADMEFFLGQMQVVLPVVGADFLRPKVQPIVKHAEASPIASNAEQTRLILSHKKLRLEAIGVETDQETVVLAGSQATKKEFTVNSYASLRQSLINDGALVDQGNDLLTFKSDVAFASPSAAAAVILNRNSNGRIEWRVESTGQTLKEWQDAQLASIDPKRYFE